MSLFGVDISNHQTMAYRTTVTYQAADFVIVQAIDPPEPFTGWDRGGYTADQLRAGIEDDKYIGVYVWLWNSFSTSAATKADIASRLALIPDDVLLDMRLWLDMEDTTQDHGPARQQDVLDALEVMDQWSIDHDLPLPGIYSGDWYIRGYMDAWFPPERVYWQANYALSQVEADEALLPMRPCIQYTSTPIDQNVMLESEIVNGEEPEPVPDDDCIALINGLSYVADDLGDKLLAEAKRPSIRKTVVRDIVKEMARVRTEQVGPRPT